MKHAKTTTLLLPLLLMMLLVQGCAYGIIDDKRLIDTMSSDKAMASSIKTSLLSNSFFDGLSISVYCYYRHVFLVGEIPENLQDKAVGIAQSKKPRSVSAHWFTKKKAADSDLLVSGRLRTALIGARGLSSTRVDTETNSGRVVLLGVVGTEDERQIAIRTARNVKGVQKVISYLMLPPRSSTADDTPAKEEYDGLNPTTSEKSSGKSSGKTRSAAPGLSEPEEFGPASGIEERTL